MKQAPQPERITVHVPLSLSTRGGRKLIKIERPQNSTAAIEVSESIARALAKAYRWRDLIENGQYDSITDLAKAQNVNQSYACRLFKLTLLSPSIIEAALDGRLPPRLGLNEIVKPLPAVWAEQHGQLQILA
jgi:hypothetical protein